MKFVAITNCPTGIAHTYMAAEALEIAAKKNNVLIKVETQGSVGAENVLTEKDIEEASVVIISAAVKVDMSRFKGKQILEWNVDKVISGADDAIKAAIEMSRKTTVDQNKIEEKTEAFQTHGGDAIETNKQGVLRHLFTGISYMLPLVSAGGLLIALSFLWGLEPSPDSIGGILNTLGGTTIGFMIPVFSAYVAYSIADRPGIAPGLAIGAICIEVLGIGFLGAIIGGLAVGYVALYLKKIKLPRGIQGIHTVLFIPLITIIVVGFLMITILGKPIEFIMTSMTSWLNGLSTGSGILLGAVIGLMTAFDMGGPFDKVAYTFSVGLLSEGITVPMAANMAAGMTPALGLALATVLFKNKFSETEIEAGKSAWLLGACFITEGAIPFAASDPLRVLPATMLGSAVTGALSIAFGCTLAAPHGGIFAIIIPGVVGNVMLYLISIAIGVVVTAVVVNFTKSLSFGQKDIQSKVEAK